MKKEIIFLLTGLLIGALAVFFYQRFNNPSSPLTPVATPMVSPAPTTEPTSTDQSSIQLLSPQEGDRISSPLTVSGLATGVWYFEATFPVVLTNWDGLIIAEGYATAEGDWMTEELVPFTAELVFERPEYGERGSLILQKANPSGLPEHDEALEITVFFGAE